MKKIIISILVFGLVSASAFCQQWGLYTLYSVQNSTAAYLIDTADSPATYHSWTFSSSKKTGYSSYLTHGDTLVRSYMSGSSGGGGSTGGLQKVLWNGTVYWDITYANMHHDICPLPNGNVLVIAYDNKTSTQAVAMGANSSRSIKSEKIVELKRTGQNTYQEVWVWYLWDHLCQEYSSSKPNYYSDVALHPELLDINVNTQSEIMHMNGIDYNASKDQIVFSCHNLNELFVIDHSTTTAQAATHSGGNSGKGGDFLYRWGCPSNYDESGTTNFNVIHDARWIPSDHPTYPNCISAFNNKGGSGSKSASDVIDPPDNGYVYSITSGEPFLPTTYNTRYTSNYSCNNMGGQQRLPNGNTFMCVPASATYLIEVNSAGTSLWNKTVSGTVAQAIRYSKCYVRGPVVTAGASLTSVCSGNAVTLNSSAVSVTETSPTYTYAWSSTNGYSGATQTPVIYPTVTGTYTVTITNTAISCSSTASVTVTVLPLPEANAGNDVAINAGSSTTLTASGGGTYHWSTGANTQSITVNPAETTTYTVTVTGSNGCTASDAVVVNVNAGTLSVAATADNQTICIGDPVQLYATPSGGAGYSYSWSSVPEGFYSNEQNPVVYPVENTVYTILVTSGVNNASGSVNITVNPLPPTPTITEYSNFLMSSAAYSYQWYLNGIPMDGAVNQVFTPLEPGNYQVEIIDNNGCSSMSAVFLFTGTSNTSIDKESLITVYPNPSSGKVCIAIEDESIVNYTVKIISLTGANLLQGENLTELNLMNLCTGIYYVYIYPENKNSIVKRISIIK
ncbi:MAG: aryl-sulfate sulfotransferase [Bacteroidales bacterium]|nr:aryl-sulfate sulfotransferase [Bacteroidales bacterium]HQP04985.1 aryl-sulfate sulfotransferase [Bacteroidales bacterium]